MAQEQKGKTALITGANKGIGFEVARELGSQGVTVLLGARNTELGKAAEAKLKADGIDAQFVELDVTKPETIKAAVDAIASNTASSTS
jgi:NAD(P)-dependent dehydrogenase (short-subunit alcohol dehydrogenase family)